MSEFIFIFFSNKIENNSCTSDAWVVGMYMLLYTQKGINSFMVCITNKKVYPPPPLNFFLEMKVERFEVKNMLLDNLSWVNECIKKRDNAVRTGSSWFVLVTTHQRFSYKNNSLPAFSLWEKNLYLVIKYLQEFLDHTETLWRDTGVQECYSRAHEYQLIDSAK